MAIQSPNPPNGPIAAAPGVTVFEINNVTTAEPVPKNTRKNVPKSSAKNFFLMLQVILTHLYSFSPLTVFVFIVHK